MPNTSKLLISGSFLRLFTLVLNVAVAFYMMPFIINNIGDRWYGLWVIVGSVMGYYGLLDFGLSAATQRFISKSLGVDDFKGINTAVTTSFITFIGLSAISILITVMVILFSNLFFPDPTEERIFQTVILILGIKTAVNFPLYAFNGVITAKLRFDIASYIQLGKLILRTVLFIYFINHGGSIIALAAITAIVEIAGYLVLTLCAYKLLPSLAVKFSLFQFARLKKFINYGKFVFITSIADMVRFTIDELVIAAYLVLSLVTHYVVAARLIDYMGQAMGAIFGVLMPVFTKDYAKKDWDALRKKFMFATKISLFISFLLGGLVIILGDEFIALWMGEEYLDAYPVLVVLAIASLFANSQRPSVGVLYAIAKHKYYAYMTMIEAVFNLTLSVILIQYIGLLGVAIGTAIPLIVSKSYFQPRYTCKQLNLPLSVYFKSICPIVFYSLGMFFLLMLLINFLTINSYLAMVLISGFFTLAYVMLFLRFIITIEDAEYLTLKLPILKSITRRLIP